MTAFGGTTVVIGNDAANYFLSFLGGFNAKKWLKLLGRSCKIRINIIKCKIPMPKSQTTEDNSGLLCSAFS